MKYCPNCGTQLPDNANFCASCGSRVEAAPQETPGQAGRDESQQTVIPDPIGDPSARKTPGKSGQKLFSMDNFRANREAQKQRMAKMKWWHWALIAIGVAMLTMMKLGA